MEWFLTQGPPGATVALMLVAVSISFANSSINRILISRIIGWNRYKVIRKEIADFQAQTRKALRSKDKKLSEKIKKREPQIMQMQKKMAKPQFIMLGVSFSYILVWWFLLTPFYGWDIVAYIPGYGGVNIIWWYMLCSMFSGIISSRILGIMSTE
jgi:uncharacterized membrane protein (DUF106 family)